MLFRLLLALAVAPALLRAQMRPANAAGVARGSISYKVGWLAKNAVALRSIDPRDEDFADLRPLKELIGDSRIVLLGEPWESPVERNRSDRRLNAAALNAKQRLIHFLHEEMGFDVLASGASLFDGEEMDKSLDGRAAPSADLLQANSQIKLSADALSYQDRGLLRGESQVQEPGAFVPAEVFDYARATRKTGRTLHVSGFGFQVSRFMAWGYAKRLFQFIDRFDPRLASAGDRKAIKSLLAVNRVERPTECAQCQGAIARLFDGLGRLPAEKTNAPEIAFFRRTLGNLAIWEYAQHPRPRRFDPALLQHFARLQRLSQERTVNNLIWLAKEWRPGGKIIVWSDNFSILKNLRAVVSSEKERAYWASQQSMFEDEVDRELGAAAYAIAFTAVGSDVEIHEVLRAGPAPSLEPATESIEGFFHARGQPYAFLDFRSLSRDHWLRQPIAARFLRNLSEVSTWPLNFDAVLCIDLRTAEARR